MIALALLIIAVTGLAICMSFFLSEMISIILAFMNFLPIPALDGGHIMFVLYEMFSGKKPNDKFLEYAHGAGFILLISLFLYANGMDLIRAFS